MGGKVNSDNYVVIQGWMINDLNLKGNELLIYAIIYGFSQAEGQIFNGSLQYLAEWTNSTKQGVSKNLKSLVEKGFIGKNDKYINGVKFCEYYATKFNGVSNKVEQGMQQSLTPPIQQSLTNNISLDNTSNNTKKKKEKEYLSPLGEFQNILLTKEELEKIKANNLLNYIEDLSIYLENNPSKKYASHYATILTWDRKDKKNNTNASKTSKKVEKLPDWFNKQPVVEQPTALELAEMEKLKKELEELYS